MLQRLLNNKKKKKNIYIYIYYRLKYLFYLMYNLYVY